MSSDGGYDDGYYDGGRASSYLRHENEEITFELSQHQDTIEELETEIERLNAIIIGLQRRKTPVRLKAKRV